MALPKEKRIVKSSWKLLNHGELSDLHSASRKGNIKTVKKLINEGCNLDIVVSSGSKKGYTALHLAAENDQAEIIKILINNDANIYLQNENGSTPLHIAFEKNSLISKLLILLKLQEYTDIVNDKGLSHFHIACSADEVSVVEKFLASGAQLNNQVTSYSRYRGDTPLHFACSSSRSAKTVKYLLERGADFTLKNANNETPLHIALKTYYEKGIKLILQAFFSACSKINEKIEIVFTRNKIPTNRHINFKESFIENFRPLHFAVKFQLLEIIKILIENGVDVRAKDSKGMTALHCAVQDTQMGLLQEDYLDMCLQNINSDEGEVSTFSQRLVKIVDLLLKSGSDVNAVDNFGRTPIFYLYERLSQRAELNTPSRARMPRPLSTGAGSSAAITRKSVIRMLFSYSPSMDVRDHEGNTILHLLAKAGICFVKFEAEVAEEYLKKGGNVNALNDAGYTALHYACGSGHTELLKLLLDHGADVNLTRSQEMERPIHRAVRYLRGSHYHGRCRNNFDMAEQLLKHGAYLDAPMTNGMTPILLATSPLVTSTSSNNLLIMCLLNWGCDLNCADSVGRTPLHYVCKLKNLPMLEVLLKHGADINAVDHHGNTAFSIIRKSNRFSPVDCLVLYSYLKRLIILGVPLNFTNRKLGEIQANVVTEGLSDKLDELLTEQECRAQIEFMKNVHVDKYTTLYDILVRSTNSLTRHVNNEKLLDIFWDTHFDDDYPVYGYLVKAKIKSAKKRAALLEPAREALTSVLRFELPDSCIHGILAHLGNPDLKNLIEAVCDPERCTDENETQSTHDVKRPRID